MTRGTQYHLKYLRMMKHQNISVSYISTGQRPDTAIDSQKFYGIHMSMANDC